MECLLPYLSMVTVPHIMVGLERMLDYRGVGLERVHCIFTRADIRTYNLTCVHTYIGDMYVRMYTVLMLQWSTR